jgi:DNA replication and repair protein RecF
MVINEVFLKNVRNYGEVNVGLGNGINILYGNNAQGKTSLLEGIYYCAKGRSHRTTQDRDLVKFGETEARFTVHIKRKGGYNERIDARLCVNNGRIERKGMAVNGLPIKRLSELFGTLLMVIFSPEDLMLVKSGPGERRRYVDMELCQLSAVYCHVLGRYHKALKQRNALLKNIQKGTAGEDELFIWNAQLFEYGSKIIKMRADFIEKISSAASDIHADITDGREKLEIIYKPDVIANEFEEKLLRNTKRDVMTGTTGRGTHKDEIIFLIDGSDARVYGSQGQQRTASLSAKLAEIDVIIAEKREVPVLMLDDVFSELDGERAKRLVGKIGGAQAVITCTGVEDALNRFGGEKADRFHVSDGKIVNI